LVWRVLFWVLLAGAGLGVFASVVVPASRAESIGTLALSAVVCVIAAVIRVRGGRLPMWAAHGVVVFGTLAITGALLLNGESVNDDEMFYLWVSLFSFYFFPRRQALAHVAVVGVAYAGVLATQHVPDAQPVARWLVTVGSLLVAGMIVGSLNTRSQRLISRLSEAAHTDPLTGLLNRSGFHAAFEIELARSERSSESFSLLVGDLDHFKQVNDRLGHQRGDRALERVSAILSEWTRTGDLAVRLGGEEFALVVHSSGAEQAGELAERIGDRVREAFADDPVPLTMSFGVAVHPEDGADEDELLAAADRALYAAKHAGRDRTVLAGALA